MALCFFRQRKTYNLDVLIFRPLSRARLRLGLTRAYNFVACLLANGLIETVLHNHRRWIITRLLLRSTEGHSSRTRPDQRLQSGGTHCFSRPVCLILLPASRRCRGVSAQIVGSGTARDGCLPVRLGDKGSHAAISSKRLTPGPTGTLWLKACPSTVQLRYNVDDFALRSLLCGTASPEKVRA